jgi:hypothetical protein
MYRMFLSDSMPEIIMNESIPDSIRNNRLLPVAMATIMRQTRNAKKIFPGFVSLNPRGDLNFS